ncbi:MAG: sensor histidine kinase [Candidatus Obscuribacterales bacterium]|nr:sensor histidine kinase [Steroidobacteraceae bacterium]
MDNLPTANEQLCALAAYFAERRDDILSTWRRAVDQDPELTTSSTIPRNQFVDHIPAVLDAFERRLCAEDSAERAQAVTDQKESASEHGLHRWQQGYNLPETMFEWGHLHLCLLHELERYAAANPQLRSSVMPTARRAMVRLCSDGVCASASRYANLQQAEAGSRVRDLESALMQLRALEQERAEVWREAAHDLRGSAHVIANVSAALARGTEAIPDSKRTQFSEILRRGVASLNQLLADLMDQARLEAGQEQRNLSEFDVAEVLKEFCDSMRPVAAERNLFLKAEGPQPFRVEGDPVKVRRIVQNLMLNALKVTEQGGIKVTWAEGGSERRPQWMLCVQDTGPGFKGSSATPLERVLKEATTEAHAVEERALLEGQASTHTEPAPTLASQTSRHIRHIPSGEGIGLSIVKRLCELLDASLELETAEGEGTTFRVTLPRRYG